MNANQAYSLNMTKISLADYIRNMSEPTVSVNNNVVTMTFTPIPNDVANMLVSSGRLKFQVVRHKANSSHTKKINFPYTFQFAKYVDSKTGIQNEKYGLSIPNNGDSTNDNLQIVTNPTINELTSGTIIRDMSELFNNIKLKKCQVKFPANPYIAEFYFGFIYWENWNSFPDVFKMGYYSRQV